MKKIIVAALFLVILLPLFGIDFDKPRFGLRGGVGTDVSLVPAFGGELSLLFDIEDGTWLEFALGYFHGYDKWEGDNYVEETTTNIFLVRANRLYNYEPGEAGTFYFLGTGVGVIDYYWEETSPVYTSYHDEEEGTGGGLIVTLGLGQAFTSGFELRLDLPILIVFGTYTNFAPMIGLTAGMRF